MLSRSVIAFLPSSKRLLISRHWLWSTMILEPKKIKSVTVSTFLPSIYHEVMGLDAMNLVFRKLSLKPAFSLSSFTIIKRLFSLSFISAIRVVSSAYLRLLIFLPTITIPAYNPSSPALCRVHEHSSWDGTRSRSRGATPCLRSGAAAQSSYLVLETMGSSWEELPRDWGQGLWPRGANLHQMWGAVAELCWSSHIERPHFQGKRNPSKTVGTEKGEQRADRLKLQSQTTSQSDHRDHSLV